MDDSLLDCSICLDTINLTTERNITLACSHAFHASCIITWLASHNTCPMCRAVQLVAVSAQFSLDGLVLQRRDENNNIIQRDNRYDLDVQFNNLRNTEEQGLQFIMDFTPPASPPQQQLPLPDLIQMLPPLNLALRDRYDISFGYDSSDSEQGAILASESESSSGSSMEALRQFAVEVANGLNNDSAPESM